MTYAAVSRRWLRALWSRPRLSVWYHPTYRLPLGDAAALADLRRADFVAWTLLDRGAISIRRIRTPTRVRFEDLARVHTDELLASLNDPDRLARIFAIDPSEVSTDELLDVVRLATGATLEGARECLANSGRCLNLLGGFHHAGPAQAGGFCAVNDIAVAIAALRAEGFDGQVAVLDLDAHPPDGTAQCLRGDGRAWIGSLSGAHWEHIAGVDETVLPEGCGDDEYDRALTALLARMPRPELAFVVAGGDVLGGDRLGLLGLSPDGVRRRDARVAEALDGIGSVWLPGGGYHPGAWRVLASTALVLAGRPDVTIPPGYDPLEARFDGVAAELSATDLRRESTEITAADIEGAFGAAGSRRSRLVLGYYSAHGIEHALHRYGLLAELGRLGYGDIRVAIDQTPAGDRLRVHGRADGAEHLLAECVLDRMRIENDEVLYVHWLTLRHPRARFGRGRTALPGQEVPGLGLGREADEMLVHMAERLGLAGVAVRPAHHHVALRALEHYRFLDPERQGRFEALVRDLGARSMADASQLVEQGSVRLNGEPYRWEPDVMVRWVEPRPEDRARVEQAKGAARFSVVPGP